MVKLAISLLGFLSGDAGGQVDNLVLLIGMMMLVS
jgi:hypothetical protein